MSAATQYETRWVDVGPTKNFPADAGIAVLIDGMQIAVFQFSDQDRWFATQNMCPHRKDMVLARGLTGDHQGEAVVVCPLHKKAFALQGGHCLNDDVYSVRTYAVEVRDGHVFVEV